MIVRYARSRLNFYAFLLIYFVDELISSVLDVCWISGALKKAAFNIALRSIKSGIYGVLYRLFLLPRGNL